MADLLRHEFTLSGRSVVFILRSSYRGDYFTVKGRGRDCLIMSVLLFIRQEAAFADGTRTPISEKHAF